MRYSYRIFLMFLVLGTFYVPSFAAESWQSCETQKDPYAMYNCRVKEICEAYKPEKPTYKTEWYKSADTLENSYKWGDTNAPALWRAGEIYRKNIGSIYKCAMIEAQKNSLEFLKEQLKQEKSWAIDDTIGRQIEQRNNKLDLTSNRIGCSLTEKDKFIIKENLLRETSFEMCKYISYLEYLRLYYATNETALGLNDETVNADYEQEYQNVELAQLIAGIQWSITAEIEHTYKVYPLVFHAYSEYENNYPIHFMLEVIHADFLLLKQKLYQSLMPIAQVGYKIINAMTL